MQVRVNTTYEPLTADEVAKVTPAKAKRIFAYHWMTNDPVLRLREYHSYAAIVPVIENATLKQRSGNRITEKSYLATRQFIKRMDVYILADGSLFHVEY